MAGPGPLTVASPADETPMTTELLSPTAQPEGPVAGSGTPMLPAQWLDETLARARTVLHRDDSFMRALERQHEPLNETPPWAPRPGPGGGPRGAE